MTEPAGHVEILIDGVPISARPGTSLAAAMIAAGRWHLRAHPVTGVPRGPFCGTGVCFECEVRVDGRDARRACMVTVTGPATVETGMGTRP
ncbi:aerobic-type carbon monoxide dehydrogenase small subunit (CoxS/CutS family) [Streptosporangium becharense]|uniref:Aerobic-type carbon monoxide dehydrogenase small subunit (CoxS/CutS family) n=1 Tax=Streptosporangium becharense TaxID=1816182 RepID=A0A7W9MFL3_9ACTN|nr:(2Fe-2S)-binding protein [Streptosporangium becharense]MBB2912059.1 aerobic-type carbon monoxide dehydrogenase small subunit (CoxS/CutS family) [Streptosporangium becharense]MBB5818606.1 aerobic-type carbon monoxide dehydrogenase small subunit (CoxS/CutS family) [Streptosporangium becharense]